jgi:hypothetical protein
MQTTAKTPVEIIHELIAIHTTRKEASIKLSQHEIANNKDSPVQLSDEFIKQLMNELSNYGDAVMESVDRDNEYQQEWKNNLEKIDALSAEEKDKRFRSLEGSLKNVYQDIINEHPELPSSLLQTIQNQSDQL